MEVAEGAREMEVESGSCVICCVALSSSSSSSPSKPDAFSRTTRSAAAGGGDGGRGGGNASKHSEYEEDKVVLEEKISEFHQKLLEQCGRRRADKRRPGGDLGYPVCSDCKGLISRSIQSKDELDEVEDHVRYLQKGLLKALAMLDRQVDRFYRDLKEMQRVIQESSGGGDPRQFRNTILNAVTHLEIFRANRTVNKLKMKLAGEAAPPNEVEVISQERGADGGIPPKPESDNDHLQEMGEGEDDNWQPDEMASSDTSEDEDATSIVPSKKEDATSNPKKKNTSSSSHIPFASRPLSHFKSIQRCYLQINGKPSPALLKYTASMSPFRAGVIQRTFNKKIRTPRPGHETCPLNNHCISFNPSTNTLSVDNIIPITINDKDQVLECTKCSYRSTNPARTTNRFNAERKMLFHVLGVHLEAFKCDQCDTSLPGYRLYQLHMKMHKDGGGPNCDQCGRKVYCMAQMEIHKWNAHMTLEDREQALREGKEDPNLRKRNMPRSHQCARCGKGFRKPYELRNHMRSHERRDAEEGMEGSFMCTECGKVFKQQRNLTVHQRYKCVGREEVEEGKGEGEVEQK